MQSNKIENNKNINTENKKEENVQNVQNLQNDSIEFFASDTSSEDNNAKEIITTGKEDNNTKGNIITKREENILKGNNPKEMNFTKAKKIEKVQKVEKSQKAEKAEKTEKVEKIEKEEKEEKIQKIEKIEKEEKEEKEEKVEKVEKIQYKNNFKNCFPKPKINLLENSNLTQNINTNIPKTGKKADSKTKSNINTTPKVKNYKRNRKLENNSETLKNSPDLEQDKFDQALYETLFYIFCFHLLFLFNYLSKFLTNKYYFAYYIIVNIALIRGDPILYPIVKQKLELANSKLNKMIRFILEK